MAKSKIRPAAQIDLGAAIDRIGHIDHLHGIIVPPLKTIVKEIMVDGVDNPIRGLRYQASINVPTKTEVDVEALLSLWERDKITKKQFIASIKVAVSDARKQLDAPTFDRISINTPDSPRLTIKQFNDQASDADLLNESILSAQLAVKEQAL